MKRISRLCVYIWHEGVKEPEELLDNSEPQSLFILLAAGLNAANCKVVQTRRLVSAHFGKSRERLHRL